MMIMRQIGMGFCVMGIALSMSPLVRAEYSSPERSSVQPSLKLILEGAADYCEKLSTSTLSFVCDEKIREEIFPKVRVSETRIYSTGRQKMEYVYDYQLVRRGGGIVEKRVLIEENGKVRHEENARLKLKTFVHKNIVFSPLDLLSRKRQPFYSYSLEGRKKVNGEEAYIVRIGSQSHEDDSGILGKLWLSARDFGLLKIEWEQSALKNFEGVKQTAARLRAEPRIKIFTEFFFDKNGIRFPSRHFIQEGYMREGRRIIISKTNVEYTNYKFFTVDVDVSYKDIRKK